MDFTFLDSSLQTILNFIYAMTGTFVSQAKILAKICFVLSLGISMIKVAMGGSDLVKEITKTLMSLFMYFIIVQIFPTGMNFLEKYMGDLAFTAAGTGKQTVYVNSTEDAKNRDFLDWLVKSSDMFTYTNNVAESGASSKITKSLNLNIRDKTTGFISLDKVLRVGFIALTSMFKTAQQLVQNISLLHIGLVLGDLLLSIFCFYGLLTLSITVVISYITILIEYTFFTTVTVFFLPFMLWDGTKFITNNSISSLLNINVKFLINSIVVYLVVFGYVDILKTMYVLTDNAKPGLGEHLTFYLAIIFKNCIYKTIASSADKIASFLCGGQPSMNFGDFARAAASSAQGVRNTAGTLAAGAAAANTVKSLGSAATAGGQGVSAANAAAGGNAGGMAKAMAFGSAFTGSIKGDNKVGQGFAKLGGSIGGLGQGVEHQTSPNEPIISTNPMAYRNRNHAKGGSGGGSQGSASGGQQLPEEIEKTRLQSMGSGGRRSEANVNMAKNMLAGQSFGEARANRRDELNASHSTANPAQTVLKGDMFRGSGTAPKGSGGKTPIPAGVNSPPSQIAAPQPAPKQ